MRRRGFLLGAGAVLAAPLARAQTSGRVHRIGVLYGGGPQAVGGYLKALAARLASHGFEERRNLHVDVRTSGFADPATSRTYAEELIAERPDVLVTWSTFATYAALRATRTIPIVFSWVADPVAAGFVISYARPGGNLTGVSNRYADMFVKRLELAIELVPDAKRIAILNTESQLYPLLAPRLRTSASRAGVELLEIAGTYVWDQMVEQAVRGGARAAVPHYAFAGYSMAEGAQVIGKALEHRLPVVYVGAEMVEAGGLVSYGSTLADDARRCADQVARVLRGAKPGDVPVDQAMRFQLAVNLKTAKTIGLAIPPSVLARADRVIE